LIQGSKATVFGGNEVQPQASALRSTEITPLHHYYGLADSLLDIGSNFP
jgi:hypothetical protein